METILDPKCLKEAANRALTHYGQLCEFRASLKQMVVMPCTDTSAIDHIEEFAKQRDASIHLNVERAAEECWEQFQRLSKAYAWVDDPDEPEADPTQDMAYWSSPNIKPAATLATKKRLAMLATKAINQMLATEDGEDQQQQLENAYRLVTVLQAL